MASPTRKPPQPKLKALPGFKPRRVVPRPKPAEAPAVIAIDDDDPSASSQGPAAALQAATAKKERRELDDLANWGRSKAVHASMLKVEEERMRQEAESRRKAKAKEKLDAEAAKQRQHLHRSPKRRKDAAEGVVEVVDDDGDDDDYEDDKSRSCRPRKSSEGATFTPSQPLSVENAIIEPSDIDKVLADYRKQVEARAAAAATLAQTAPTVLSSQPYVASQGPADASKNIIIGILVVSRIEGTKPKVFNRKFGQTLGKVRETWGEMQGFTADQIEKLVLVWQNDTRVFDSTVPRSLGIRFDKEGKMFLDGNQRRGSLGRVDRDEQEAIREGIDPDECKVYFDAMWLEDFEQMVKEKEAAREREAARWAADNDDGFSSDEEVVTGIALNVKSIMISLKGKNFKDLKLKVKPNMKVGDVVEMVRKQRGLDEEAGVELRFEGDELEEDMTLEEADIEDDVQIDVVLR
ncbi:hypothetical protein DRE_06595 [Drechslerella stenobrocha 248]|uniref:Ubiquitin-like domain-containing protein n=1 Tax=Drechslerella stenobrocha 248 TaxID=1043628 RepID=W7HKT7_9PEZI|nr:hypothetical protein DRE_06595 [Drechslerella stenobrocha 248]